MQHVNYELHTNDRCLGWVLVHLLPECGACVLTSPEKWNQLKDCWRKWFDMIDSGEEQRDHKELLSGRDFLGNNSDVSIVVPYLKDFRFHLTIKKWRENRDSDGWKVTSKGAEDDTRSDRGGRG